MFECRIKTKEYPDEGELVVVKVLISNTNLMEVSLIEYNDLKGLILSNELSKKRIRSIHQVTKVGNIEVCQVLKVDKLKGHIDLSLKKVSEKEKTETREEFSKNKLAYQILSKTASIKDIPVKKIYEEWGYNKIKEYGSLYNYFSEAKEDLSILDKEEFGDCFKKIIEEKFKATSYKIRMDIDVSCYKGIEEIKDVLNKAMNKDNKIEITLLRSPTYSILKIGENKEDTIREVTEISEFIKNSIEAIGGEFAIVSPPNVYGEKLRHTLLDSSKSKKNDSKEENED